MIRKLWTMAAVALTLVLAESPAIAQQYGPPSSGSTSSILFVPATLNLVAGLNGQGYGGNGVLANSSSVLFDYPSGVAYDSSGNLYIADSQNFIVRKITQATGDINTFAGTEGTEGFNANGGTALGAQLGILSGLIVDSSNNIYVSDDSNSVVWKITSAGAISIFAGGGAGSCASDPSADSLGDGCPATDATLSDPTGLAFDAHGNLYIADSHSFLVREVSAATGIISIFAGNLGDSYFSGCPTNLYTTATGPWTPTQAHLCFPYGIGFDSSGNAYIVEAQRYLVRIVTNSTGDISTFAGGGTGSCPANPSSIFGDGCPATDAILHYPAGLYIDPANRVYFVDTEGDSIRMVDTSGTISTVLGNNGELVKASIGEPDTEEILVNSSPVGSANGIDFFTMDPNGDIVAVDADSDAATSAGSSGRYVFPETPIYTTTTTTSANAVSSFYPPYILITNPSGVALNFTGTPTVTGPFAVVTGTGAGTCTFPGTVAPGASCTLVASFTPTVGNNTTSTGTIVIASNAGNSPSTINLSGLGSGSPTPGGTLTPSPVPAFTSPANVTSAVQDVTLTNTGTAPLIVGSTDFDGLDIGNFGVAGTTCPTSPTTLGVGDTCYFQITFKPTAATTYTAGFQVDLEYYNTSNTLVNYGFLSTAVSGTGTAAQGAPAVSISPSPLVFPPSAAGENWQAMVTVDNTGTAPLTFAGATPFTITGGTYGAFNYYPNGGCTTTYLDFSVSMPAGDECTITIQFNPGRAAVYSATLNVADNTASSPQSVTVTGIGAAGELQYNPGEFNIVAGTVGSGGQPSGNGVPASSALIEGGYGEAFDNSGNLYISDYLNNTIWEVDTAGNISSFAGVPGAGGYGGDNGPATQALLNHPQQIALDGFGNMYIADRGNSIVRMVNATSGTITTFAGNYGNGFGGYAGDGGPANQATLSSPQGVAVDYLGNVYIADTNNDVIRVVNTSGTINLFAGTPNSAPGATGDGGPATSATLYDAYQVAADLAGNIYIADFEGGGTTGKVRWVNNSGIINTYAGGGSTRVTATSGPLAATSAAIGVTGVATDPAGDVYIAGLSNAYVVNTSQQISLVAGGGATAPVSGVPANAANPSVNALAIDQNGDVFINDAANHVIEEVGPNGDLVFPSTAVGATSAPMTVTLTNTGNATLEFADQLDQGGVVPVKNHPARAAARKARHNATSDVVDFSTYGTVSGPFAIGSGGSCDFDNGIAAGASCTMNVTFTPTTSGPAQGTVVLYTITPENYDYPTTVLLSGTGTSVSLTPQTIAFTQPASPVAYSSGLTIPLVATGGASGNPVVFTIDASSTGAGSISGSTLTVTGVGTLVIDANQAGNSSYSAAAQVQRSVVVTQTPQVINFTQPTSPVAYASGLTITLTATGGASGNPVVFTIDASSTAKGSISGSTLTIASTGNLVIDANQAGNANYSAAAQVQRTIVVNTPSPQTITFTQPASPVTYASGLTIALVATGGGSGNPVVFTLDASSTATGSISANTLTVTSVGSLVIDANQAGNSSYSAASQVQRTVVVTQAPQIINFAQPSSPVTDSSGLTISLTATGGASGNPVVFTVDASSTATGSVSGNVVTITSAGNLVIDANQAGNADYSAAPQVQRTVVINADFTISATPPSQTVASGASAQYTITATQVGGDFSNPVDLNVTGLPAGATAAFSPTSITPGTGSGISTLTVQTQNNQLAQSRSNVWPLATPALALLILLPFRRWRRVWAGKLLLLIAGLASLGAAAALTGCGGGFALNVSQTYTLTVTGTSGTDTHSTTVQLTVQ
jgi:NHL repeat